ncbi:MAG: hypothetical protein IPI55_02280 [Flavobacteriales bacterium]|nr:hypothetical protein [Flavobacteriales bacterium]
MANAIGLDNAEDLKGFDIRHLGDWKNTALSVLGKSNGAANAVGPVANSADSLDSATLNRAMTMLGEVLGTVRAQQENGVDRNKVVGAVFGLFMKTVELFRLEVGENSIIARIADIITKYVILDPEIEILWPDMVSLSMWRPSSWVWRTGSLKRALLPRSTRSSISVRS